ncbi:hypothetical protein UAJ10_07105 [Nitrospirillum sp. BR 11164]|uniref:hypothetical protein n=1 Tax=Nitrospirillum sp. BR 11164 TaxID=3104324 RepID=UPI002AFE1FA3|nr:hypothetical protein [Nitrospirillum sp. BR 11164]MEA1648783.1 hypothetical protein [Nitrospirillum sp. BR 11164]
MFASRTATIALPLSFLLAACACSTSPPAAQAKLDRNAVLTFLRPGDDTTRKNLTSTAVPSLTDATPIAQPDPAAAALVMADRQNGLLTLCEAPPPPKPKPDLLAVAALIAGWAIEKVGTWLVDKVVGVLDKEVQAYTTSYVAKSENFDFYDTLTAGGGIGAAPEHACFRLSRRVAGPAGAATLAMDFVGKITYDPMMPEIVTITPVRLFYSTDHMKKPDKGDKVAVGISMSLDEIGLSASGGWHRTDQPADPILAMIIKSEELRQVYYYHWFTEDEAKATILALPPGTRPIMSR